MQGMKQWCENCQEVKGLHNNCPNLTNVGHSPAELNLALEKRPLYSH